MISKLFLREAMARFNYKNHWLLRPTSTTRPYLPLPTMTLMIPGLAKSLSLGEWNFEQGLSVETLRRRKITDLIVRFGDSDAKWLNNLADYLQEQDQVEHLALTITHPSSCSISPPGVRAAVGTNSHTL